MREFDIYTQTITHTRKVVTKQLFRLTKNGKYDINYKEEDRRASCA